MAVKINFINAGSGKIRTLNIENKVPDKVESEDLSKGWVRAGRKNLYFQELVTLVNGSGIARSCASTKSTFIFGDGFEFDRKGTTPTDKFFTAIRGNDLLKRISIDETYFEGFALNILYNVQGKITEVKHIDFSAVRLGIPEAGGEITKCYVSSDWSKAGNARFPWAAPVEMPLFNPNLSIDEMRKAGRKYKGQIMYVRPYLPGHSYYVPPAWASADNRVDTDRLIGEFHAQNAENGFYPSAFMYMPGDDWNEVVDIESGETKADAFKKWFAANYKGVRNAGEMMFTFGTDKEHSPTPIPFQPNVNGDMFMSLENNTVKYIPIAFQVPPVLCGISEAGKLGSTQEIVNMIEMFQNNIISPIQDQIEDAFQLIANNFEGINGDVEVKIGVNKPIGYIPDAVWNDLTPDERREAAGYSPRETKIPSAQEQTLSAISSLSPLVANKVLDSLTPDELRALIAMAALTPEQKKELAAQSNPVTLNKN